MNPDRLLRRFMRYVQCDSESGHEQAFCRLLEEEGAKLGIQFWRDPVGEQAGSDGWNLGASIPGTGTPVLFSCHMDTVAPGRGVQPVVEGGVVRSSGDTVLGADDKSGIAAVMEALESLLESGKPHRPVELLFSVCEELGLKGAKYADYSRFASKEALVLDNDIPGLINHRAPANVHLHIQVQGRAAHAAVSHGEGVHALKAAVAAIAQIPCGAPDADTVMNVANFLAPGPTNVVPAQASFDMEIRSFVEDKLQGYQLYPGGGAAQRCAGRALGFAGFAADPGDLPADGGGDPGGEHLWRLRRHLAVRQRDPGPEHGHGHGQCARHRGNHRHKGSGDHHPDGGGPNGHNPRLSLRFPCALGAWK